jgi:hypothetical protein
MMLGTRYILAAETFGRKVAKQDAFPADGGLGSDNHSLLLMEKVSVSGNMYLHKKNMFFVLACFLNINCNPFIGKKTCNSHIWYSKILNPF